MDLVGALFVTLVATATPLCFAALGELVAERSGVLNLGVEGMMSLGAVAAFATVVVTGTTTLGILAGGVAGMTAAALFGFLVLWLRTDQVPTGLALTLFGLGTSALLGVGYVGIALEHQPQGIPWLSELPLIGPVLFGHDVLVYLSLALAALVWWLLRSTRIGLVLRAVGENHAAAHALGYSVLLVRLACVLFGGFCSGIGGAYLSLFSTPLWAENMTAGRGWIALALVVFASWRAERCIAGAYLFAGLSVLELFQQGKWFDLPAQYLAMLPYLITIVVLAWVSARSKASQSMAPADLARQFDRG